MSSNTNIGNTPVNQGYVQLIHTGETGGIDGTLRTLYDGDGTASDLQIASNKVKISTELYIGSKTITEYVQDVVGDMFDTNGSHTNITATYDDNGDGAIDLVATGAISGLTEGTGVTITGTTNKTIAIGQSVGTSDTVSFGRVNLGSTDTSSFLTGDPKISATGYMMIQGIINETETGSTPAGIVFGNNSTYGNDEISLITAGQNRLFINSSGDIAISQDLTISGDLQVNGTTTTVNQTNLDVSDNIIGLNRGVSNNTNDSGLIIERGSAGNNAAILWDETASKFTLGTTTATPSDTGDITVATGTLVADLEGNASTATALATGRTISLTGDVTGTSASFDGSGNVNLAATIAANSVALGTDTTGNYVGTITAGSGVSTSGASTGEGIAHNLSINASQTAITSIYNSSLQIGSAADEQRIDFGTSDEIRLGSSTQTSVKIKTDPLGSAQDEVIIGDGTADVDFLVDNTSGTAIFKVDAGTGSVTISNAYTLPSSDGSANQILKTNGSGTLSFADESVGISFNGSTANGLLTYGNSTTADVESGLTYDGSTLAVTGEIDVSDIIHANGIASNRLDLDDDSDSGQVNQVTLASVNNVNILIDGTNNGTGDFQIRSRPTTANDLDTADIIVDIDETTAIFDNITSQQFKIGGALRTTINEAGLNVQSGSLGVGQTPPSTNGSAHITNLLRVGTAGEVALTVNDGGGNANVTFNHTSKVPDRDGNSGRIEVNVDSSGGEYMAFELAGNVTTGVSVATTEIARINSTGLQSSLSGTAASPALRVNDSDTGLYRIADNKLGISTAGTFAVAVDASQNVGIGTSSPTDTLQVEGSIGVGVGRDAQLTSVNNGLAIRNLVSDADMFFYVNDGGTDTEAMRIDGATANVGIGTTSPSRTLDVDGIIRSNTAGGRFEAISGTSGTGYYIFGDSGDLDIGWISYEHTNNAMAFKVNASERMRIDSSGNVGIGTQSPGAKLEISNDVGHAQNTVLVIKSDDPNGDQGASSTADIDFHIWDSNTRLSTPQARIGVVGDGTASQNSEAGGRLAFYTNVESYSSPSLTERMRIDASGNVGIGETNPDSPLHIGNNVATSAGFDSFADYQILLYDTGTSTTSYGMGIRANTFMFNSDVDFEWRSDNSAKMFLDGANGRLGIGTSSPESKLNIVDSGETIIRLYASTASTRSGIWFTNGSYSYGTNIGTDNKFHITGNINSEGELVTVDSSGNVGIGVASPQDKLHIEGTTSSTRMRVKTTTGSAEARLITNNGDWILSSSGSSNQFQIYNATTSSTYFAIDSNGDVGIGGATTSFKLDVQGGSARISSGGLGVGVNPSGTTGRGDFSNDVVAYSTSDKRLKENIKPLDSALDKVLKINGVSFDWKALTEEEKETIHGNEGHDVGVIAQEIEEVLPEVVTTRDSGYKAVKYEKIVPLLIEAIKEQQQQIEELKNG